MSGADALARCAYCPRLCEDVCPAVRAERRETVSPTGLLSLLKLERDGVVAADAHLGEIVAHCIVCGRCSAACLHEATPWQTLLAARRRLPLAGGKVAAGQVDPSLLWSRPPRRPRHGSGEAWLLWGSLAGLDAERVVERLDADTARSWRLPYRGLPVLYYRAWSSGEGELCDAYLAALREELAQQVVGVAWSDPHEGRAVAALLDAAEFTGPRAYAPQLLGIVAAEATACLNLDARFGCCGGAGNYPHAAPEAAGELARRFEAPADGCVPGLCRAHLRRHGRDGLSTDWDRP